MATLSPFPGWLVTPDAAPRVVTPAYDVMTPAERGQLAAAEPDSFLNVMRTPEDGTDVVGADPEALLLASRHTLDRLLEEGAFAETPGDTYHVLRMRVGDHVQVGIVGTVPVDDLGGTVRLHEGTRTVKEQQLVHHLEVVGVQSSPIGLVHPGPSPVADLLSEVTDRAPALDLDHADGLHQQVWTVSRADEVETIAQAFASFPALYLTDGHHRAAAAVRFAERMRARARDRSPDDEEVGGPWDHVLVAVFPAPELRLYPYHRVVQPVAAADRQRLEAGLAPAFHVERTPAAALDPVPRGSVGLHLDGAWLRVAARPGDVEEGPVRALEVSWAQRRILGPLLGVGDPRSDPRLRFVPGTLGLDELARRAGSDGIAVALPPTPISDLMAVADAGEVMPPKSTWFDPKLRSGLVLRRVGA